MASPFLEDDFCCFLRLIEMAKRISLISDITPSTPEGWTVKVMVLEKMPARSLTQSSSTQSSPTQSSPQKFQRLILSDSTGIRVQATIFNKDIDLFEDNLVVFKKYFISNARVRPILKKHQLVPHLYQWTIHHRSLIEEVLDDTAAPTAQPSNFIPISSLVDYRDSLQPVDVLAIALELLPSKEQNTRIGLARIQELILIDSSLKPIVLTMWNEFIDNEGASITCLIANKPIIAAMRVKVVSYNGVSLSTRTSSSMLIAPEIPDTLNLREWYTTNVGLVNDLMVSKPFLALVNRSQAESSNDVIEIGSLSSLPDNTMYTLRCSLAIVDMDQQLYYIGYSNCHRATSARYMECFTCNYCKMKSVHGIPRCRAIVKATDSTGSITATMFGDAAEHMLSCNALTIMQKLNEPNHQSIESIIKTHTDGEILCRVKAFHSELRGAITRKFNLSLMEITDKGSQLPSLTEDEFNADKDSQQLNVVLTKNVLTINEKMEINTAESIDLDKENESASSKTIKRKLI